MLKPQELIILNGKINNILIKILMNTGSTYNFIYRQKIIGSKLEKLIDTNIKKHSDLNLILTYLRGLEVAELKEEDMPMVF